LPSCFFTMTGLDSQSCTGGHPFRTLSLCSATDRGACPLFFCRTGGHPFRTLSLCSATDRAFFSSGITDDVSTDAHSTGINRELRIVTIHSSVENLSIPWTVDGTA
nr:hypothetical protein [Tanacetum cinerariifolium]